jgi:hypothetical protein
MECLACGASERRYGGEKAARRNSPVVMTCEKYGCLNVEVDLERLRSDEMLGL